MNKLLIQRLSLVASDLISMLLAFLFSIWLSQLYHHDLWSSPWSNFFHFGVSKLLGLVVIATFWYHEQYSKRRPFWEELLQTYRLIMFFTIINLGLAFVLEKNSLKVMLVSFWLVFAIMLPLLRSLVKSLLLKINFWQRDLYVLGHGRTAQEAYRLFAKNRLMGYRLIAFVERHYLVN
jgi:undecaprenyl-phosphate galactose phosphotransferase